MLSSLHIQDFVLIDELSLNLSTGLTALTGETGAGKSILLDALGLACGGRAERGSVRQGAKQGVVTVAFEPRSNHPIWDLLEDNGLAGDDDQIILRRIQGTDGRGRGFVNDRPVSIAMLREVGEVLLEIHGQHDGRGFLTASTHRDLLDDFGGHAKQVEKVRTSWESWRSALSELEELKRERDQALREADYLRHVVSELEMLAPLPDEETELVSERTHLMAAEKMLDEVRAARDCVDDNGLEEKLSRASRYMASASGRLSVDDVSGQATKFDEAIARLETALSEVMEARAAVEQLADAIDPDPGALNDVEERLFAIRAAARKHGVTAEALPRFFEKAMTSLSTLDAGEAAFGDLEKTVKDAKAAYLQESKRLSQNRTKIASILDKAVMAELTPLKLGRAHFSTQVVVNEEAAGQEGIDQVEFMVATNPGAPAGPLKTIASGGELSRFVLAMKAALASQENRTVIIFDEVDAGVGGAVADAVGERLARLARDTQVLVVTHSPQVAARANTHWQVSKGQRKNETITSVDVLDEQARVEEIARMLSGATVTKEARAAAAKLLGAGSSIQKSTSSKPTSSKAKKTSAARKKAG